MNMLKRACINAPEIDVDVLPQDVRVLKDVSK